jgi:hypothetical protein
MRLQKLSLFNALLMNSVLLFGYKWVGGADAAAGSGIWNATSEVAFPPLEPLAAAGDSDGWHIEPKHLALKYVMWAVGIVQIILSVMKVVLWRSVYVPVRMKELELTRRLEEREPRSVGNTELHEHQRASADSFGGSSFGSNEDDMDSGTLALLRGGAGDDTEAPTKRASSVDQDLSGENQKMQELAGEAARPWGFSRGSSRISKVSVASAVMKSFVVRSSKSESVKLKSGDIEKQAERYYKLKREQQRAQRRASAFNIFALMLSVRTLVIMVLMITSVCGVIWHPLWQTVQMIEVVNVLPNMPNVFKALATRWLTLVETFLFGMLILFYLAVGGLLLLKEDLQFSSGFGAMLNQCQDLGSCFVIVVEVAVRQGSIGDRSDYIVVPNFDEETLSAYVIYYFLFSILVNIIWLQVLFSIIIDGFGELRSKQDGIRSSLSNVCFICHLPRHIFDAPSSAVRAMSFVG